MSGLLIGLLAMLPMLGLTLFWQKHRRSRGRGLAEALGAIALAVLIGMLLGPLVPESDSSGISLLVPILLGGLVMSLALNRMVRDEGTD